jgi:hypothetical protein
MSSAYDSAVIDTAMIEDSRLLALPRGIRFVHIEAIVRSKLMGSDGLVSAAALLRLTDEPNPQAAAAQLVAAGVWELASSGWQIIDFEKSQMSAARVKEKREAAKARYDTWQRSHAPKRVANATANGPARPALPARAGGGQVGGGVAAGQGAAAATFEGLDQRSSGTADTVDCTNYSGHHSHHRLFSEGWRCDICDRRRLAANIRVAEPTYKSRLLRAWERSYGQLYGRVST